MDIKQHFKLLFCDSSYLFDGLLNPVYSMAISVCPSFLPSLHPYIHLSVSKLWHLAVARLCLTRLQPLLCSQLTDIQYYYLYKAFYRYNITTYFILFTKSTRMLKILNKSTRMLKILKIILFNRLISLVINIPHSLVSDDYYLRVTLYLRNDRTLFGL